MAQPSPPAGYEDAAAGVFPPFDPTYFASQLFWLAISFAVLYFLLSRWLLPRIGSTIEERKDRIADDLDAAASLKTQADDAVKAYEKSLADARAKAQAVGAEARAEAEREAAAETASMEAELDQRQSDAEARIAKARNAALSEVRNVAADVASTVTEHLAGLKVKREDAESAVDAVRGQEAAR
ncbi:F0F1 ATP synthase subunit B [Glycocaulis abyssi]|uniref:ATP synthase subunit b n=1 Tax=Glycocaulis abyssi TaxID=1433403 RepID=A0ABV9NBP0_9PROT